MPEQLEFIVIEVNKSNSVPMFISTWYRPPGTPIELFDIFESVLEKIDSTNGELYLLGDLNRDLLIHSPDCHTKRILELCQLYNASQLIKCTNTSNVTFRNADRSLSNNSPRKYLFPRCYSNRNKRS